MKTAMNWSIAILAVGIGVLLRFGTDCSWIWIFAVAVFALLHIVWAVKGERNRDNGYVPGRKSVLPGNSPILSGGSPVLPCTALTELVLLGEDNNRLASWNIYGKNGLVIGRDVGENHVAINLDNSTYASMIEVEHAVLNYSGDNWYIEDISEKNGVSIQKQDGRKYKLAYGKPCKLEKGDIIYIALSRLQIW